MKTQLVSSVCRRVTFKSFPFFWPEATTANLQDPISDNDFAQVLNRNIHSLEKNRNCDQSSSRSSSSTHCYCGHTAISLDGKRVAQVRNVSLCFCVAALCGYAFA